MIRAGYMRWEWTGIWRLAVGKLVFSPAQYMNQSQCLVCEMCRSAGCWQHTAYECSPSWNQHSEARFPFLKFLKLVILLFFSCHPWCYCYICIRWAYMCKQESSLHNGSRLADSYHHKSVPSIAHQMVSTAWLVLTHTQQLVSGCIANFQRFNYFC